MSHPVAEDARILIVDDDADRSLCAALERRGAIVDVASDGFAAIELLQERRYRAILLEPLMKQGLNAFAVLNYIEMERADLLGCVFLTTAMSEQTVMHTAPTLLTRLFRKPLDVERLAATVLGASGAAGDAAHRAGSRRVLLAEDDTVTAVYLGELLQALGFEVTTVDNGRDAIRQLTEISFELILVDLMMPDIDGFAMIGHLTRNHAELLPRVIVLTGIPDRYLGSIDRSRLRGVLHKPIDAAQLRALLAR